MSIRAFASVTNLDPIPGKWYAIYSCDNGAMVIDKSVSGISGSFRSFSTQLVIRDQNIVDWFVHNNAVYSQPSNRHVIFGNLFPRFENELFHSDEYLTQVVKIFETAENVSIQLIVSGAGSADWFFRDCKKTENFHLFQD
jgi:hypothetical protein